MNRPSGDCLSWGGWWGGACVAAAIGLQDGRGPFPILVLGRRSDGRRSFRSAQAPLLELADFMPYLLIRKTVDWRDEAAFFAQLSPEFAPKVETWNETFRTPYHLFRQAIREISIRNHAAVAGLTPASWEQIPDRAIVVPSDDDDWFAPDLAHRIADAFPESDDGIHWTQSVLEVPINGLHRARLAARRIFPWMRPKWLCATNNYAFRKGSAADDSVVHTRASRQFESGKLRVSFVPERLSLHNRTLASITSLAFRKPTISASALRRKADAYRRLYDHPALPEGLGWAAAEIRSMRDVMADLTVR